MLTSRKKHERSTICIYNKQGISRNCITQGSSNNFVKCMNMFMDG